MVQQKIKELARLKAAAAKLETQVAVERIEALASLPEAYGYADLKSFIKALKVSAGTKRKGKPGRKAKAPKVKKVKAKRTRAKITPEIKEQLKALVTEGLTGSAIAKKLGISLPSVQNIKKELGLVKARGAEAAAVVG